MTTQPVLQSTLTCPHCGHQATETMPTNACQFFYDCTDCGELLRPKGVDLSGITQAKLNAVARQLNERPRETLGFETPIERFQQAAALTG